MKSYLFAFYKPIVLPRSFSTTWTSSRIIKSPFKDVQHDNANILSVFLPKLKQWADRDAIECSYTKRKYTYGEILDGSLRVAALLRSKTKDGPTPGTIGLFSGNNPEFPIFIFGGLASGSRIALFSAISSKDELKKMLIDSGTSVLIADSAIEKVAIAAIETLSNPNVTLLVNGPSHFGKPNITEVIKEKSAPKIDPIIGSSEDIAFIPYSSGTTGNPKGVALSHRAVTNTLQSYIQKEIFANLDNIVLGVFDYYLSSRHSSDPYQKKSVAAKTISLIKPSILHVVPPVVNFLINSPIVKAEDLKDVETIVCAAALLLPSEAIAIKEKIPEVFLQEGYGMTETLVTNIIPVGGERIGYVGPLLPNVLGTVVDSVSGNPVAQGERGELWIKSSGMMSYYLNNPEATKETIDYDGWLHTGDIAEYSEDGYFKIVDRIKELIKVKGLQVSPSELEEILVQHPAVVDAGIVPIPDTRAGELPRAYVVTKDTVTEAQLQDFVASKVSPYKQLKGGVKFCTSLPKSPTGKLLRRVLKEIAEREG